MYIMKNLQRLSSLQVIPVHLDKRKNSEIDGNASVYCTDKEHFNEEYSNQNKTIENLIKLKRLNSGNVPQQQYYSTE